MCRNVRLRLFWYCPTRGICKGSLAIIASAIAAYEDLIDRSGANEEPECLYSVPWALLHKGNMHKELGDFASAIVSYEALIERFGASDDTGKPIPRFLGRCVRREICTRAT